MARTVDAGRLSAKRAALYLRRSTEEHQAASLAVQEEEARRYLEQKGWSLRPEHVFSDSGVSRAEFAKRPGLVALLRAAEQREFDVLVTRDDSRLGGDMIRVSLLLQELKDAGVAVHYYYSDEEVLLDGAVAKFMVSARNFAAELEREKISQRTHEHLLVKARRGLNVGGRCYGYDNVEVKEGELRKHVEYAINAEQADIVREVFTRYARGEGIRTIARELNRRGVPSARAGKRGTGSWAPSALFPMLRRTRYIGVIEWNKLEKTYRKGTKVRLERDTGEWLRIDCPSLRIVSDDLWEAVQRRINDNAKTAPSKPTAKKGGRPPKYLLSSLARCGCCGGPLTAVNSRDGKTTIKVYVCAWRRDRGEAVCSNGTRRPVESVNNAVLGWVQKEILNEEIVLDTLAKVRKRLLERTKVTTKNERPELEARTAQLRGEIKNLVSTLASAPQNAASVLVGEVDERQKELNDLEARLRAAKAAPDAIHLEIRRMQTEAKKLIADLRTAVAMEPEKARAFLATVFDGKLTATPIKTEAGPRFQVEGRASLARMLVSDSGVQDQNPPKNSRPRRDSNASPGGPDSSAATALDAEKTGTPAIGDGPIEATATTKTRPAEPQPAAPSPTPADAAAWARVEALAVAVRALLGAGMAEQARPLVDEVVSLASAGAGPRAEVIRLDERRR